MYKMGTQGVHAMHVIEWIRDNWGAILQILTLIVSLASAISTLTPTDADNRWVRKFKSFVDFLALNVGHARNPKVGG